MSNNLVVDDQSRLQGMRDSGMPPQPMALRLPAKIISFIFHPLFVPVYVIAFLVYIQPYLYSGFSVWDKKIVIIQGIVMYTFFPLITVGLLKALKFIDSIYLKTQRDRIIPFIACGIWYFWAWYVRRNLPGTPFELVYFSFAILITSSLGLIANIYMKVSMHAMAMGVASTFLILMGFSQDISFTAFISITVLITGLVCTARLLLADHTPAEIYTGLFIGAVSIFLAYFWMS
jgi:hypothetical protein